MAENNEGKDEASAMKAYAEAAADTSKKSPPTKPSPDQVETGIEAAVAQTPAVVVVADSPDPLNAPSAPALKQARARKAAPAAPVASAVPPRKAGPAVANVPLSDPVPATPVGAKAVELMSSAAKLADAKPLPAPEPAPMPAPTQAVATPQPAAALAPIPQAALESAAPTTQPKRLSLFSAKPKEKIMETTSTYADNFKQKITETQGKAKEALGKGRAALGEVREFSRGNLDAVVASGKILVAGLREIRETSAAGRRSALETLKADFSDLRAVKSPTDFFKLQGEIARKNLDSVVATGSKNSEAVLKLTREAIAPISGRLSLAVEKVKAARA